MADDSSAKRLKTAVEDGAVVADMRRRNAQLESEVRRLRSENEQLRRRNWQLEGNHEMLPVSLAPFTVDLSRVDTPCDDDRGERRRSKMVQEPGALASDLHLLRIKMQGGLDRLFESLRS